MSTFKELSDRLSKASGKKVLYQHLADYISKEFIASTGKGPKSILLREDQTRVDTSIIEGVVAELIGGIQFIESEIKSIETAHLSSEVQSENQTIQQGAAK